MCECELLQFFFISVEGLFKLCTDKYGNGFVFNPIFIVTDHFYIEVLHYATLLFVLIMRMVRVGVLIFTLAALLKSCVKSSIEMICRMMKKRAMNHAAHNTFSSFDDWLCINSSVWFCDNANMGLSKD